MSNLLVQTIKHTNNTTAQTIDTSGRTTVSIMNNDSTFRSDGGAVTQNMVQGLAKAFANSNPEGTNLNDGLNISSLGDQGTGLQRFNLSNAMNNTTFATVTCVQSNIDQEWEDTGNRTTSMAELRAYDETSGYTDVAEMMAILGDLA
jgi:hypothetical protein